MSETDNIEKPADSNAAETGVIPQLHADASLNQSDSPSVPERPDTAEPVEDLDSGGNNKKRKSTSSCQICKAKLKDEKPYYQRYRICPYCSSKDRLDELDGLLKRFCQQCGKFQSLQFFDGTMRTCRERLDRHAARRRKSHARQAAMRRGSPVDDMDTASPRATYSPPPFAGGIPQHQQYFQPLHHLPQHHQQLQPPPQPSLSLSHPMLDLAQQLLQRSLPQQRSFAEQQRAMQQQQQRQMMEQLMATIAASRPAPNNLLNPLYQPTPLRFGPSPHGMTARPAAVDPMAAAGKLEAVLAVLLSESAAVAPSAPEPPPPPPPPPPQPPVPPQNDDDALHSMLQRLIALANAASGASTAAGGGTSAPPAPASPRPAPVVVVPASNTNSAPVATTITITTAPPPALAAVATNGTNTGTEQAGGSSSSLPAALAGLSPQLQAALVALLKQHQESSEQPPPQQ